jgi:hypothetical protein
MHDRICPAGRVLDLRHVASDLPRRAPEAAGAPEDHTAAFVAAQDGVGTRPGSHPAPRLGVFFPSVKGLADEASGLHLSSKQPIRAVLSADTVSVHDCGEPSRLDQVGAAVCIVLALVTPLALMFVGAV